MLLKCSDHNNSKKKIKTQNHKNLIPQKLIAWAVCALAKPAGPVTGQMQ